MESQAPEAAPTVLADLIAAGLVSHEMIGDPAKLGGEAACLRALCALVAGPVYRIEPYHYAFRAGVEDLDGALGALPPGEWAEAIEAGLAATLGEDAVWLNATDLLPEADAALAQPILLLRAQDRAVTGALESAGPEIKAVINARYAAECARLTLEQAADPASGGALAARLAALEARQETILSRLDAQGESADAVLTALSETLSAVLQRLETQDELLNTLIARDETATFQKTLGVTLAEFLARLEQRSEEDRAAMRMSQFS